MRRVLALALLLAACVPQSKAEDAGQPQADCPGGKMVVTMSGPTCVRLLPDAGKACTSNDQCEGSCMADSRTCSASTPMFGCFSTLENGVATPMLCVD
ncbi:hypothetical protein [Rhodobacter ferrooxidans]|uniref:Putative secreted protein n=1 Tax=Rhodobacter ferrooxidans TaxID=371731 RepID=C8RYA9_9RHOB|nr:hypothetical protein [Rhodobacter sp. SW2]EEW26097.1 putative secreted protein [Rhodobacter sp. SW2]